MFQQSGLGEDPGVLRSHPALHWGRPTGFTHGEELAEDEGIEPSPLRMPRFSRPLCALHGIFLNWWRTLVTIQAGRNDSRFTVCFRSLRDYYALKLVCPVGFEPTTPCAQGRCSNRTELRTD